MKIAKQVLMILVIMALMIPTGCGSNPSPASQASPQSALGPNELDLAIRDASYYLNDNIPAGNMVVILNVQSDSAALSDYIIDELIGNAVNDRIFKVVDRQQLDLIRTEQNFQLSGEVDDNLALSIGKFFGAQTIVSGKVSQVADRYRMTIRALEVQTAQVQGQYNRNIIAGVTMTALMKGNGGSSGGTATNDRQTQAAPPASTSPSPVLTQASTPANQPQRTPTVPLLQPAAIVNLTKSETITVGQLWQEIERQEKTAQRVFTQQERREILDGMINDRLINQAAERDRITVNEAKQQINQLRAGRPFQIFERNIVWL